MIMEKKNMRRSFGILSAVCGVVLMAGQAWAFGSAVNTSAQIFGCGTHTIDLNGVAAGTDVSVFMPAAGPLVALFNAECSVKGTTDTKWLDINVYIDGVLVAPSSGDNAFCTSTGDNALDHWVSASTNGVRNVAAGFHTIRVRGTLSGCAAGDQWRIDDISTIGFRGL
jgi:hypothetical protein